MNFHKRIRKKLQIIIGKTPLEFGTLDYWIYTVGISLLLQLYFHKHARFWKNSTKKKKSSFFGVLVHVFMSHFTEKGGKKQKKFKESGRWRQPEIALDIMARRNDNYKNVTAIHILLRYAILIPIILSLGISPHILSFMMNTVLSSTLHV